MTEIPDEAKERLVPIIGEYIRSLPPSAEPLREAMLADGNVHLTAEGPMESGHVAVVVTVMVGDDMFRAMTIDGARVGLYLIGDELDYVP